MASPRDIVITGVGVVSPNGIGGDAFWKSLAAGTSGIRPIDLFDSSGLRTPYGGQIPDFDPKVYVRPRKSLKVMSRDIQLGFAAADLALGDASLAAGGVEPEATEQAKPPARRQLRQEQRLGQRLSPSGGRR